MLELSVFFFLFFSTGIGTQKSITTTYHNYKLYIKKACNQLNAKDMMQNEGVR